MGSAAYKPNFEEQLTLLKHDAPRLDEILDGVTWAIATHADDFEVVDRTLRVAFTDPFPDAPAMRIFFQIQDDDNVTLNYIEHLPLDDEEEYL